MPGYRTPMMKKNDERKRYPFTRKSVEAKTLSNFATVLDFLVRHPDVSPRLKLKEAENG